MSVSFPTAAIESCRTSGGWRSTGQPAFKAAHVRSLRASRAKVKVTAGCVLSGSSRALCWPLPRELAVTASLRHPSLAMLSVVFSALLSPGSPKPPREPPPPLQGPELHWSTQNQVPNQNCKSSCRNRGLAARPWTPPASVPQAPPDPISGAGRAPHSALLPEDQGKLSLRPFLTPKAELLRRLRAN